MFDAKSILEQLMRGGQPPAQSSGQTGGQGGQGGGMGDLGDLLRQFTEGGNRGQTGGQAGSGGTTGGGMQELPTSNDGGTDAPSALDELMRQFSTDSPRHEPATSPASTPQGTQQSAGGALEDLLRQFTEKKPDGGNTSGGSTGGFQMPDFTSRQGGGAGGGAGGGIGDLMGEIFGSGKAAAGQAGENAQDKMREILEKIGGSGPAAGDMMRQLTDFIGNNKVGAGAALGGLGALIFGTRTGRSIAMSAAKVGALAVVGGLAYKAYQNYSQGRPLVTGSIEPEAAPTGSGFEENQVSNQAAVTYIRGMIAAAAADGRISADEQHQIIGALNQQGVDSEAEAFLANELNNPASIDELVAGVTNQTEGLQLYTAARVSIEPDTAAEQQFLAVLADRLGIPPELRTHVDAAARGATT